MGYYSLVRVVGYYSLVLIGCYFGLKGSREYHGLRDWMSWYVVWLVLDYLGHVYHQRGIGQYHRGRRQM